MFSSNKKQRYQDTVPFEERRNECERITAKYPLRIPCIVETKGKNLPPMTKCKYLIPHDLTFQQFMYVIRKRLKLTSDKGIFALIEGKIVPGSASMGLVREQHKDPDGFTYVTITEESVFGSQVYLK